VKYDGALKFCRRSVLLRQWPLIYNLRGERLAPAPIQFYEAMAKEHTDRTTLDLFADERRPGRPKTSPLSRDEQLRINKRNQLKRDKGRGLRRVELKMNSEAVEALNTLAEQRNLSRSELIEQMLLAQLKLD